MCAGLRITMTTSRTTVSRGHVEPLRGQRLSVHRARLSYGASGHCRRQAFQAPHIAEYRPGHRTDYTLRGSATGATAKPPRRTSRYDGADLEDRRRGPCSTTITSKASQSKVGTTMNIMTPGVAWRLVLRWKLRNLAPDQHRCSARDSKSLHTSIKRFLADHHALTAAVEHRARQSSIAAHNKYRSTIFRSAFAPTNAVRAASRHARSRDESPYPRRCRSSRRIPESNAARPGASFAGRSAAASRRLRRVPAPPQLGPVKESMQLCATAYLHQPRPHEARHATQVPLASFQHHDLLLGLGAPHGIHGVSRSRTTSSRDTRTMNSSARYRASLTCLSAAARAPASTTASRLMEQI